MTASFETRDRGLWCFISFLFWQPNWCLPGTTIFKEILTLGKLNKPHIFYTKQWRKLLPQWKVRWETVCFSRNCCPLWRDIPGFQQTCPSNINQTKRFLKTTIRSQSCIPLAWQCRGGEGLAGTPKAPSISDRIKGRFGSQHYRGSAVFWQERMLSVLLPYLEKASRHITECAMEKRKRQSQYYDPKLFKTMSIIHTLK